MVVIDTLAGVIDARLTFHYDIGNDVLYLRKSEHQGSPSFAEETEEGLLLLRHAETDEPIGLTVDAWWRRSGDGPLPDSMSELSGRIEAWSRTLPVESPAPSA
jgi:hypothetical protein